VALDPQGKAGTIKVEGEDFEATYPEYAEYLMGQQSVYSPKPDPASMRAFIAKYPESRLLKRAYDVVSYFYYLQASKEDAAKFFAEFAGKFPDDPGVLDQWLTRINRDKDDLDKGLELAGRIKKLTRSNPVRRFNKDIAEFYMAKGDNDKAEEIYGKDFMEGQATRLAYDLIDYANFWTRKSANKDSALAMVDLALKMRPDALYVIQQAASIYVKNGQEAKALEVYGPAFAQKNADKASPLSSYASFWANQGKNLDGALSAAKRAVELKPEAYYGWVTLGNVYLKLKNYDEAVKAAQKALDLGDDQVKDYLKKNLERIQNAAKEKK
jgi:tetratricopeptide (TPR) repeat protein